MKLLLALLLIIASFSTLAEVGRYTIRGGKLHEGGSAFTKVLEDATKFSVTMGYELKKKRWVPVPSDALKGDTLIDLPIQYKDERGYMELEAKGSVTLEDGSTIKFIRRTTFGKLSDAYEFVVYPRTGKARVELIYHPELPSVGWGRIRIIFISNISVLNGYEVIADLIQ